MTSKRSRTTSPADLIAPAQLFEVTGLAPLALRSPGTGFASRSPPPTVSISRQHLDVVLLFAKQSTKRKGAGRFAAPPPFLDHVPRGTLANSGQFSARKEACFVRVGVDGLSLRGLHATGLALGLLWPQLKHVGRSSVAPLAPTQPSLGTITGSRLGLTGQAGHVPRGTIYLQFK